MSDNQQGRHERAKRSVDREPHTEPANPSNDVDDGFEASRPASGLPHWASWAPSRTKLFLALGPIIAIPLIVNPVMWVGRAWLVNNEPLLLMALSNKAVNLALAVIQVSAVAYYLVAIARRVVFAPCYFYLGRWGADRGLEWIEKNSPSSRKMLDRLRRWFPTFGPLLVIFYPAPIVRVLAGASSMRFWVFWLYEWIGAIFVAVLVRTLAFQFPQQLQSVLDFIKEYTWEITIASFLYIAAITYIGERRNAKNRPKLEELEEAMLEGQARDDYNKHHDDD